MRDGPHRVALLDSGWKALALRVHLIRTARESIDLQTFIWTEDAVGKLIGHELVEAARRGVRTRVLGDGLHTRLSAGFAAHLASAHANLELRAYKPGANLQEPGIPELILNGALNHEGVNQRAHDKLMVVDGRLALIGGRNLEDTYYDYAAGRNFLDREVLVEGAVVADARASFERFWADERTRPWTSLADVAAALDPGATPDLSRTDALGIDRIRAEVDATLIRHEAPTDLLTSPWFEVERAAFCCDVPGKFDDPEGDERNHVSRVMAGIVRSAERSVLVQTPYFVLTEPTMRMLAELRAEHPEILLRASSNSLASTDIFPAQAVAYRQKRRVMETLGVHLYEFKPRPADLPRYVENHADLTRRTGVEPELCLHSKSAVVDGEVAGVGSHNFGPRSARLNTEVMLWVWDADFAAALRASIERDMQPRNSWVIWRRQRPPLVDELQSLLEQMSGAVGDLTGLDLWPSNYASCFELESGAEAVPPGHPDFYGSYRPVGLFPGLPALDERAVLTRLLKAVGSGADRFL